MNRTRALERFRLDGQVALVTGADAVSDRPAPSPLPTPGPR